MIYWVYYGREVIITNHKQDLQSTEQDLQALAQDAKRAAVRENAKHIFRESGLAEMLQGIHKNLLKGRGRFEEYDSIVLLKWGTGYTLRHIWVEVEGSTIRFRLHPHRKCANGAPLCDGEYHTFTQAMWADRSFLQSELKKYYDRPVAETSSD